MLYVGLDVHSRQSSLCILNSAGGTVNEIQLKGPRSAVVDRLRQLDQPLIAKPPFGMGQPALCKVEWGRTRRSQTSP